MSMTPAAPVTRWIGRGHDRLWVDSANWGAGTPAAGGVAAFARPGLLVDLASAGASPVFDGQLAVLGGSLTISDGALVARQAVYDGWFFTGVGLRVDGGLAIAADASLLGQNAVVLGDVSAATLDIRGTLADAQVYAGRAGAVSVTVEGAGARWATSGIDQSFQFGGAAPVSLVVRGGGYVGDGHAWSSTSANSTMTVGGQSAGASVLVTGRGSGLRYQIIDVGGSYSGTLSIAAGAHVADLGANIGQTGDAAVSVAGAGSVWDNANGLFVHGAAPHGSISITDHARVSFGSYGLQDSGSVLLDSTARLDGATIVLAGGALSGLATAAAAQSTVTITQSLVLGYNDAAGGNNLGNFLDSAAGVTLALAGAVSVQSSRSDPLAVGGGHVALDNPANGEFAIDLYGGVLELAAAGASGGGGISFLDRGGATLQIDQPGALASPIGDFAVSPGDVIDLQALVFAAAPVALWQPTADGGTLLVSAGTSSVGLTLDGRYAAGGFHLASDLHGGTAISYSG